MVPVAWDVVQADSDEGTVITNCFAAGKDTADMARFGMMGAETLDPEKEEPIAEHDCCEVGEPDTWLIEGETVVEKAVDTTDDDEETLATESYWQVWKVKHLFCLLLWK